MPFTKRKLLIISVRLCLLGAMASLVLLLHFSKISIPIYLVFILLIIAIYELIVFKWQ